MSKDRECVNTNARVVFYASMWEDFRRAGLNCGWALGLHGSLANDMDIMAMPWVEEATSLDKLITEIRNCFSESQEIGINVDMKSKPNNRIVVTFSIWGDCYIDMNVINNDKLKITDIS